MKKGKAATSFYTSLLLPEGTELKQREAFSQIVGNLASRFSFQGMEDWAVELDAGTKVLGIEREFHDLSGKGKLKPEIRVYFAKKEDAGVFGKVLMNAFEDIRVQSPKKLIPRDWMKLWRKFYKTQMIQEGGQRLAIVPSWKKAPAGKKLLKVRIAPGQAFGTGTHATTRLCLQMFLRYAPALKVRKIKVLDFGAGTGVLAIAAEQWAKNEKLSFQGLGVESDPEALKQGKKNVVLNRSKVKFQAKVGKVQSYNFVFANVLAPVLLEFRDLLSESVARGGFLVLSGLLASEIHSFAEKFLKSPLEIVEVITDGDWGAIVLRKA